MKLQWHKTALPVCHRCQSEKSEGKSSTTLFQAINGNFLAVEGKENCF
jgi:hypothetical protein